MSSSRSPGRAVVIHGDHRAHHPLSMATLESRGTVKGPVHSVQIFRIGTDLSLEGEWEAQADSKA